MAISNINLEKCTACGLCATVCSLDVIRINKETSYPVIAYPQDCMLCDMCVWHCPSKAITVTPEKTRKVLMSWG